MLLPIVIHKDRGSDYGVTVPDLPGCFSAGESILDQLAGTWTARDAREFERGTATFKRSLALIRSLTSTY